MKVIKYGQYVDIPVKIIKNNENYCVIANYTKSELKELGLSCKNTLKVYDRLIIQTKER